MQEKYIEKLYKIFFGHPPKFLLETPVNLSSLAFSKQGLEYEYNGLLPSGIINLNFTQFIQDIYDLDKARIKDYDGFSKEEVMHLNGVYMRSEFYEWIEDRTKDNWQKVYKCIYYRGLLISFVKVHNYEIIDNQPSFVNELLGMEKYYTKLIEQEIAPFLAWENKQQQKSDDPMLSSLWSLGIEKLKDISGELKLEGFIKEDQEFKSIFDTNKDTQCNWLKTSTSLVYLFYLIFSDKSHIPIVITSLMERRLLVKNKPLTRKHIQTTLSNIRKHINKNEQELGGDFATVYEVYKNTIPDLP